MGRSAEELLQLLADLESDQVERKEWITRAGTKDPLYQAVWAFANDLPDQRSPGVHVLKQYRSLMPLSYEAHMPIFALKPADGAFGGHQAAVRAMAADFGALAERILTEVGGPDGTSKGAAT
ncbi:hypothetical protein ACTOB_000486 [Actinoplanes oblitus]|uniref:Uncharacterized protein n=1 Tax=Actinoplanes oblitus TaxID=3040509 RepID=A0ABY8WGP8_9ACTN|nr:hypothetical protein [Actinoplanes oblitus]WIM97000.1 hypothetical protein ACTOB_000486 [Actinoplanes oblitus]